MPSPVVTSCSTFSNRMDAFARSALTRDLNRTVVSCMATDLAAHEEKREVGVEDELLVPGLPAHRPHQHLVDHGTGGHAAVWGHLAQERHLPTQRQSVRHEIVLAAARDG